MPQKLKGLLSTQLRVSEVRTCKHHDVLKVGSDLVLAAQVEQEGQRVDVCCPAKKHGNLHKAGRSRTQQALCPLNVFPYIILIIHFLYEY